MEFERWGQRREQQAEQSRGHRAGTWGKGIVGVV